METKKTYEKTREDKVSKPDSKLTGLVSNAKSLSNSHKDCMDYAMTKGWISSMYYESHKRNGYSN